MQHITTQRVIAAAVTLGIIAAILIAYQALVEIPRERIEAQEKEAFLKRADELVKAQEREDNYNSCMFSAYNIYSQNWDSQCTLLGREKECSLKTYEMERIEKLHKESQERCVQMYK